MTEEGRFSEAKSLAFGYAAIGVASLLSICAITEESEALAVALYCFAISVPTGILAGVMFHLRGRRPKLSIAQKILVNSFDGLSLLATGTGLTALIWHKNRSVGLAFGIAVAICVLFLVVFVACGKKNDSPTEPVRHS